MTTPWDEIKQPEQAYNVRRVSNSKRWKFYWAKDNGSKFILLFRTGHAPLSDVYPRLEGIVIESRQYSESEFGICLILQEKRNADVFVNLCNDVVSHCESIADEEAVTAVIVNRLRMWQSLLKKGATGLLTIEQQRGLAGELTCLKDELIPALGQKEALAAWYGPDREAHDFIFGHNAIEVKTRTSRSNVVQISSEAQLTHDGVLVLMTKVVDTAGRVDSAVSLAEFVCNSRDALDTSLHDTFDKKLLSAGYIDRPEYEDSYFMVGKTSFYRVEGEFPRLARDKIDNRISRVKYFLDLSKCAEWLVDDIYGRSDL